MTLQPQMLRNAGCDRKAARTHRGYSVEKYEEKNDKEVAVGEERGAGSYYCHENRHGRHQGCIEETP